MNGGYCYFNPNTLPFDWRCSDELVALMTKAATELGRLDGMISSLGEDSAEMLMMNLSLLESTTSSYIEGTRSTVDDLFRSEKEVETDGIRLRDNQEVCNYRRALLKGFQELPVGGRITVETIPGLHHVLMDGAGGSDKSSGEFRDVQTAVGRSGDTLETAKFVPAPPESIDFLMDNWLDYINSDSLSTVEKLALAHYQFESIHPFRDGNGRVGRLLTMLILRRDGC